MSKSPHFDRIRRASRELHRRATTHHRIGYDERRRRYEALHAAVAALVLPFKWHPVAMDNPTQNHAGSTNGRNHIVLDEPYKNGRLAREQGAALCGVDSANLWGEASSVTCKACLRLAVRESRRAAEKGWR